MRTKAEGERKMRRRKTEALIPESLERLPASIISRGEQSAPSPSLPCVTCTTTDARAVVTLREWLDEPFRDPAAARIRDMLGLTTYPS
jgi:hypothetical protein